MKFHSKEACSDGAYLFKMRLQLNYMPACICIQFQLVTSMNNFALSIYLVPTTGRKKRETVEEKVIQLRLIARSRGVRRKVAHYVALRTQRRHTGIIKRGCR